MTKFKLRELLGRLDISQVGLARLVDVTPRAVNLWMSGARNIPGPVAAYLRLLTSLPSGMRQAELARLSEEIKSMKDGMYVIEFAGQTGAGYGTLILDGGRIYGVDVAGGKYDGGYEYNESTELVDVNMRVQLPANQPSVIGIVQPFDWILEVSTEMDPRKDYDQVNVRTTVGERIVAKYRYLRPLPVAA